MLTVDTQSLSYGNSLKRVLHLKVAFFIHYIASYLRAHNIDTEAMY